MLSAKRLVDLRRHKRIRFEDLTRLLLAGKAKPFIVTHDYRPSLAGQNRQRCGSTCATARQRRWRSGDAHGALRRKLRGAGETRRVAANRTA